MKLQYFHVCCCSVSHCSGNSVSIFSYFECVGKPEPSLEEIQSQLHNVGALEASAHAYSLPSEINTPILLDTSAGIVVVSALGLLKAP